MNYQTIHKAFDYLNFNQTQEQPVSSHLTIYQNSLYAVSHPSKIIFAEYFELVEFAESKN